MGAGVSNVSMNKQTTQDNYDLYGRLHVALCDSGSRKVWFCYVMTNDIAKVIKSV